MNKPLISVICAIYNMELFMHRCIDSIINQTFKNFELILVDDGSTDLSGKICDQYAELDNRIVVIHKENAGVSSARQTGINLAKGDYTIHVDPDDWIELNMLEKLYEKAQRENADMVISDYYVNIRGSQIYEKQKPTSLEHEVILYDLFKGLHANCWNKLIRRSCYINYGVNFPVNINFREDFCVIVQLLLHPIKVTYINQAFYHYVRDVNVNSIASSINEKKYYDQLAVINQIEEYFKGNYVECLNILKADVATWLVETGFKSSSEIRNEFRELLDFKAFINLPHNRQIKIMLTFFGGEQISKNTHKIISKIKSLLKLYGSRK